MSEYDIANTIMGQGTVQPPPNLSGTAGAPVAPMGAAPTGVPGAGQVPPGPGQGSLGGLPDGLPPMSPMAGDPYAAMQPPTNNPPNSMPMGKPLEHNDPMTKGPYPDVFKFMQSAEGKKITRAAVDSAIRAATKQGVDVKTKDITDVIVRTARGRR